MHNALLLAVDECQESLASIAAASDLVDASVVFLSLHLLHPIINITTREVLRNDEEGCRLLNDIENSGDMRVSEVLKCLQLLQSAHGICWIP